MMTSKKHRIPDHIELRRTTDDGSHFNHDHININLHSLIHFLCSYYGSLQNIVFDP